MKYVIALVFGLFVSAANAQLIIPNGGAGGGAPSGAAGGDLAGTYPDPTVRKATFGALTASTPFALTQTWNNAAVTFTGLTANITDTASNAASLLMDLQVGGASKFSVNKAGNVTSQGAISAATFLSASPSSVIAFSGSSRFAAPADGQITLLNSAMTSFTRLNFGGTTASFPALKVSSTILQARLADDSDYSPLEASTVRTKGYTVSTLPTAGSAGRRAYVTDATTCTLLGALTGSGSTICPVFDNGTAWVGG